MSITEHDAALHAFARIGNAGTRVAIALLTSVAAVALEVPPLKQPPATANAPTKPATPSALPFIENVGQVKDPVKFYLASAGGKVYFTTDEVVFDVVEPKPKEAKASTEKDEKPAPQPVKGFVIRLRFPGANAETTVSGVDIQPGRINDFRGNDPAKWHKNIPTYRGVAYKEIYPGVDLEYFGEAGQMKRRLVLKDLADLGKIRMSYVGPDKVTIGPDGSLALHTALGVIREIPVDAVLAADLTKTVATKYVQELDGTITLVPQQ